MNDINCLKCKHYHATWDPQLPRGCKLFGIKSVQIPSVLVKKESGGDCKGFELHPKHKGKKPSEIDLNDPRYW